MLPSMSDDPAAASFLDRVNTLSFPAVVGLGAAAGVLLAVLSALSVEGGPTAPDPQPPAHSATAGTAAKNPTGEPDLDGAGGDGNGPMGVNAAGAATPADPSDAAEGEPPPEPGEEPPPEPEEPALEPDVGAAVDVEVLDPEDDTATDEATSDKPVDAPPPPSPAGRTQAERDAEAKMDADELLTAAQEAYQDKRYKDAYRLATRSHRSRPRDKAQMLRGRSACRLRNEKTAREIVRSFKLGDEHRKTLRTFCKDRGVRVGL